MLIPVARMMWPWTNKPYFLNQSQIKYINQDIKVQAKIEKTTENNIFISTSLELTANLNISLTAGLMLNYETDLPVQNRLVLNYQDNINIIGTNVLEILNIAREIE